MQVQMVRIVGHEKIAHNIFKLTLLGDMVGDMEPGQFVNVRVGQGSEFLLRRPISICEINAEANTFVLIYRAEGQGTQALSQFQVGQEIDVLGPLGEGYSLDTLVPGQTALLVGGGIGVPPLYELAKQFNQRGIKTIHILGFNSRSDVFYEEEFKLIGETYLTTVDGSIGDQGFVTDVIRKYDLIYDQYFACGPLPMLKALKEMNEDKVGYLSLEERMACGVGACYACVCKTQSNETARVCYDGPVFKAEEIIF